MADNLYGLARMTVSSSGTGTITLNAAVSGFLTFDAAGCSTAATGNSVSYAISDTTQSELGRGTYFSSSKTLTRGSSKNGMKSTNSDSAINMSNAVGRFITPTQRDFFQSGTTTIFYQAAAPTGWTLQAISNRTIRVSSAGGTIAGTVGFDT